MNCRSVEERLALYVGGGPGADLSAGDFREVAEHLASCERCRSLEESYRASQQFLQAQGPAPFGEEDYTLVRKAVRAKLEAGPRGLPFRVAVETFFERSRPMALAFAAAVLLVIGLLVTRSRGPQPPVPVAVRPAPEPPAVSVPSAPPVDIAVLPQQPAPPRRPRPRQPALPRPSIALAVSRIEIQTPNPNIRIIWLPSSPDTSTSETDPGSGI